MQKLSSAVRIEIEKSAINEFFLHGFNGANMRSIAWKAGITVGNIYRYFKNKNALFTEIVSPAYSKIIKLITAEIGDDLDFHGRPQDLEIVLHNFISICLKFPKEIVIILDRYLGAKNYKLLDNLKFIIIKRLKDEIPGISDSFSETLNHLILKGTLFILQNEQIENYEQQLHNFYLYLFKDITERI